MRRSPALPLRVSLALLAAGIAIGVAPAAPAGEPAAPVAAARPPVAALVAVPQHAILILGPTDTRHIWLVSLATDQLTYTAAEHATEQESLAAGRDRRAAVKLLSGDVYAIDPRTGRFAAFDELTGKFSPRSHADARRPDDPAAAAGAGPQLHTEIAEGSGATASEAIQDALRNAVRQAVGVYVDSETLTDKDDVVSDRVLTASDAFVGTRSCRGPPRRGS
jgi:hypothetical protein